jgi:hypothetical protein
MSCGGPTKKMQAGGTAKKMQAGSLPKAQGGRNVINRVKITGPTPKPELTKTGGGRGPIKTIKKVMKKLTPNKTTPGCFGAGCGKMQEGGTLPKAQNGGWPNMKKVIDRRQAEKTGHQYPYPKKKVNPVKKAISTIKKTISNIGKPKPKIAPPKYELGGSLETFQKGGGKKSRGWQMDMDPLFHRKDRCDYKKKKKLAQLNARDKAGRILKGIGKTALGAGVVAGAGALAYKKSPRFKMAFDQFKTDIKDKLGLQKGGIVKKYQNGGPTDSLKIIKKEGKLAVKTEKQKQAAAKKAAALAKKIAKAKENARLNLEWERMSEDEKDAIIRQQRSRF